MRRTDEAIGSLFRYGDLEERVSSGHPPRRIRQIVNCALARLDVEFEAPTPISATPPSRRSG